MHIIKPLFLPNLRVDVSPAKFAFAGLWFEVGICHPPQIQGTCFTRMELLRIGWWFIRLAFRRKPY
jgi:hypothetical protein